MSARLDLVRGDYEDAERKFEQVYPMFLALEDAVLSTFVLSQLAWTSLVRGDYELADTRAGEALESARACGDQWALLAAFNIVGGTAIELGDLARARATYEEAAALARLHGDAANIGVLIANVAEAAIQQGDYDAAVPLLEETLTIARNLADRRGETAAILDLASIANYRERYEDAEAGFIEGLLQLGEDGEAYRYPETLGQLAISAAGQGELERAARLLGASAAEYERIGAAPGVADRARFDAVLERARAELGDAAERAYTDGRALSRDDATAYACRLGT